MKEVEIAVYEGDNYIETMSEINKIYKALCYIYDKPVYVNEVGFASADRHDPYFVKAVKMYNEKCRFPDWNIYKKQ